MDLKLHPEAKRELHEAVTWYDADYPGRGRRFYDAVMAELRRARAAPHTFPAWRRRGDVRGVVVPRFPYTVIFRAEEGGVMVYAVAHHKRRPGYWRSRLRNR